MRELTLAEPSMYLIAGAVCVLAGFIRGFAGFGGPAILILVLVQFFNPLSVVSKVIIIDLMANIHLVPTTFREVRWRVALPVTVASLLAAPIGVYALSVSDPVMVKKALSFVVAICVLPMLAGWRYRGEPNTLVLIAVGVVAGVVVGATFIALPVIMFFYASLAQTRHSRANAIFWGVSTTVLLLVIHMASGTIVLLDLGRTALVGLVYLVAAWLGARLFRGSTEKVVRTAVICLLFVLAGMGLIH